ncbi:hypothetical protein TVAG_188680 [Trichomonas vaginalis G3]|uniref:Uncharacterized protein n=1 Tax=Trichomonas vaginalis (strain ATCC PRA-98 / G3) TaxID=412133 RepID=A2EEY3_TRIV3|nr:hypothetical protein TVAGG3_0471920 [Trichomonas vaginalis G3]EAY08781.1 hypothetical protein TVAG_188680 [Trichomonas vaginalis G3]KAI5515123.1 hypothetical protein TVAGG3_0471920 [Trichomonas vaginalis G3]|eukprot:XP_001321004.1 hypothetical protein [Trichomonas vaginalis G3]
MDSGFGDPSLSSTQLRQKAYTVIKNSDRPLASCEIEKWIRNNDYDLWCKVSAKCKDYVRVILSQTRGKTIAKFKSLKPIPGIDKRSTFYGIYGRAYPSDSWVPTSDDARVKVRKHDDDAYDEETNYSASKEESSQSSDESAESSPKIMAIPIHESPKPVEKKERVLLPPLPPFRLLCGTNPIFPSLITNSPILLQADLDPINLLLN